MPMSAGRFETQHQRLALISAIVRPQLQRAHGQPGDPNDSGLVGRIAGGAESSSSHRSNARVRPGSIRRRRTAACRRHSRAIASVSAVRRKRGSSAVAAEWPAAREAAARIRDPLRHAASGRSWRASPAAGRRRADAFAAAAAASAARRPRIGFASERFERRGDASLASGGQIVAGDRAQLPVRGRSIVPRAGRYAAGRSPRRGRRHAGIGERGAGGGQFLRAGQLQHRCEPNSSTSAARWASVSWSLASSSRIGLASSGRPRSISQ